VLAGLLDSLRRLSDAVLITQVKDLALGERSTAALLVAHLAELDTRDVHLRAGHGSLFVYCRDVLALSEQEAYARIAAARAARRFPTILELLEAGAVNLTTLRLLAPHLTPDNHEAVLASARGKTKLQVEEIVARLCPLPDVPSFVRKLPAPRPAPARMPEPPPPAVSPPPAGAASPSGESGVTAGALRPPVQPRPVWRSADINPLSPDRYKVQITIGRDTLEKLRLAKDLLRHAVPSGDEAAIFDRALTALLTDLARRKFAATERRRPASAGAAGSRHVPADVKRAVWLRDLGRCAFVGTNGRRCGERAFLEFHHVRPHAMGGAATAANIQLRCRSHNDYEARVDFGRSSDGSGVLREPAARYG
jgi:hypothetical protein